jgi:hypothetical protein
MPRLAWLAFSFIPGTYLLRLKPEQASSAFSGVFTVFNSITEDGWNSWLVLRY